MKKDKKWLKNEISENWLKINGDKVIYLNRLIDQLDEPLTRQEVIDELNVLSTCDTTVGYDIAVADCMEIFKKYAFDEPQKVVVPKWFDEWMKKKAGLITDRLDLAYCIVDDLNAHRLTSEQKDYIIDHSRDILSALLHGYEVEKEKLYWVRGRYGCALLQRDGDRIMNSSPAAVWEQTANPKRYQFTEREINRFDKRFWAFSVPVEEEQK